MKGMISPSMMCCPIVGIDETLKTFEKEGIELLHLDIMDGVFVPNITLSNEIVKQYRPLCSIPFDYHLMIVDPLEKIDWFELREGDFMSFHLEATDKVSECLSKIRSKGAKAGLVIKPKTPVSALKPFLGQFDFLLIMCVEPGFAGQKLIPETLEKIAEAKALFEENGLHDILIEADGNVSFENAVKMREKGADIFVAGTSSVFKKGMTYHEAIAQFRGCIE